MVIATTAISTAGALVVPTEALQMGLTGTRGQDITTPSRKPL